MREILAKARSIRELLSGAKYSVDYYQREYKWQTKQVMELLRDLSNAFLGDFREGDPRSAVAKYGHYFLGSIILSDRGEQRFIVDGQQRLTTLTLLLIYLHNLQRERADEVRLNDLIFSEKFGQKSFNLDVPDRTAAMESLFNDQEFDPTGRHESVQNIVARYRDIEAHFPEDFTGGALPYFVDWLIENVHLVEITAYSDEDAYTIFETMNDRGLSLTPLDMLKGFILANITDEQKKVQASQIWKARVTALVEWGKDVDADAFKAWLRSQYANSTRERRKGAAPGDFDRLGSEFHRWIKDNQKDIGLLLGGDGFYRFVQRDMDFYTRTYEELLWASYTLEEAEARRLETVFYNAGHEFSLQYPLLLAPLVPGDDADTVRRKLRIVAAFVDILIAWRAVNYMSLTYSTMEYAMFLVIRDIRRKPVEELAAILTQKLEETGLSFDGNADGSRTGMRDFALNQWSKRYIREMLARITDHIERRSGMKSRYAEYVAEGKNRYEIEHIWANHWEDHRDEFRSPQEFADFRNRIGGLLLLPKSFNASYGDMAYGEKLPHYLKQNLLAQSLHPLAYKNHPGFLRYIERNGHPFRSYPDRFDRNALDERQEIYQKVAEEIWNPARLTQEVDA